MRTRLDIGAETCISLSLPGCAGCTSFPTDLANPDAWAAVDLNQVLDAADGLRDSMLGDLPALGNAASRTMAQQWQPCCGQVCKICRINVAH